MKKIVFGLVIVLSLLAGNHQGATEQAGDIPVETAAIGNGGWFDWFIVLQFLYIIRRSTLKSWRLFIIFPRYYKNFILKSWNTNSTF